MSSLDPRAPVIVGSGQISRRRGAGDELLDPASLAAEALRLAAEDSGAGEPLLRRAGSVRCVASVSWFYRDVAALVAEKLGIAPRETVQTAPLGGDFPQRLINDTAEAIAAGRLDVALVAGAEANHSMRTAQRDGKLPEWPVQPDSVAPSEIFGSERIPFTEAETAAGLAAPIYVYALIEQAIRARSGADRETHLRRIAALWSRFSAVAADNPHAWTQRAFTPEELSESSAENRLVSDPYLKLLSANLQVDQAAGLIITSAEAAEAAGVPRDRWVFIWSGAGAEDEWFVSQRRDLAGSPAIAAVGRAALGHAGLAIDDVAHIDLYSCFPSAVEIAATEFGLDLDDPDRPLTTTGGLTFAGGPGNNYGTHGVATLAARLRDDPDAFGLATALGWFVTKHGAGVYSARPPSTPYRLLDANETIERPQPRAVDPSYTGPATLEAYTVPYARDGSPEAAIVSALTPDGSRTLIRTADPEAIAAIAEADPLGREVRVAAPDALSFG